jgi:hypothetical protein
MVGFPLQEKLVMERTAVCFSQCAQTCKLFFELLTSKSRANQHTNKLLVALWDNKQRITMALKFSCLPSWFWSYHPLTLDVHIRIMQAHECHSQREQQQQKNFAFLSMSSLWRWHQTYMPGNVEGVKLIAYQPTYSLHNHLQATPTWRGKKCIWKMADLSNPTLFKFTWNWDQSLGAKHHCFKWKFVRQKRTSGWTIEERETHSLVLKLGLHRERSKEFTTQEMLSIRCQTIARACISQQGEYIYLLCNAMQCNAFPPR